MGIINKDLLKILVCPQCNSSLKVFNNQLICSKKDCQSSFLIQDGIPILLPNYFQKSKDFLFKKAQIDFFDRWSNKERGKGLIKKTSFDHFFSKVVGEKKINYAEEEMRRVVNKLPKNSLVLELGCGAGEHTVFLARLRKDIHLVTVDLSFKSVIETRARIEKDKKVKCKVSLIVADAEELPFKDKAFSAIIVVMFFHHVVHIDKALGETKRLLSQKGVGLIVDILANNPLVVLARKIFPHLPFNFKKKFSKDYLLEDGEIPQVMPHKLEEIKREIKKARLKIIKETKYDLFLFTLNPLGTIFTFFKYLFPELILNFLYNIEKKMLKNRFWQKFSGAASLWISRQ